MSRDAEEAEELDGETPVSIDLPALMALGAASLFASIQDARRRNRIARLAVRWAAAFFLVIAPIVVLFVDRSRVNWGTFPDWLAGLGASLTLAFLSFDAWRNRKETRFANRERHDGIARQARLVFGEVVQPESVPGPGRITVVNHSADAVVDVELSLIIATSGGTRVEDFPNEDYWIRVIPPGGQVTRDFRWWGIGMFEAAEARIEFMDASRRRWRRDGVQDPVQQSVWVNTRMRRIVRAP